MRATLPTPCVTPWRLRRRRFAVARPSSVPAPDQAPSHAAVPVTFPPTRIASAAVSGAVCAKRRRTVRLAPVLHKSEAQTYRCALARRSARAHTPFLPRSAFPCWLLSSHHYGPSRTTLAEGFIGRLHHSRPSTAKPRGACQR